MYVTNLSVSHDSLRLDASRGYVVLLCLMNGTIISKVGIYINMPFIKTLLKDVYIPVINE